MNKYTGRGEEKNKEIVINLKSNENQNQSDPMNFNRENQNRGIQKSRAELLEELKNQTTGSVASNTSMTGPSAMFMAKTSGYSLPDTALTTIYTNPILAQTSTSYPGVPPPPPFGTMEGFPQPVPSVQQPPIATVYPHNSAAPPIPTSNMPSVAGNEELRKQAELLEEQIKLMQRLEELKRQIGGGSTSASVGPSTAPPVQQPQNPAQIFGSPPAPQMQQPFVDPIRLQRLRVLRAQLPAFIPDWCIEFVNEAEKITPFYLQKICEAVQDPMELRQLLMEPSYCHEHDPGSLTCVFHRHVGLQHSTLDCVMTLPWSRRLRLAELNKICLDKKMCIMPHRGECTLRSQPCQFCGEPHFLAWCKKQAMLRNLYDVADEQPAISAIPNAPMAAGNPNVVPTYSYS